jgi:F-type H+-transporting ATPase subunit a
MLLIVLIRQLIDGAQLETFTGPLAHGGTPELPNIVTILVDRVGELSWTSFLHHWENVLFSWIAIAIICFIAYGAYRRRTLVPGRLQAATEIVVESLDNLVTGVIGREGRKFTPFCGTLFLYIICMNMLGLVPGMKSPSSSISTTAALAICVFVYVQYTAVRSQGILGYLDHLLGQPRDLIGFILIPIMLPIHIIGELARPLSLALRLFGNITGEDVLIAVFVGLGVASLAFLQLPLGLPLQIPFIFLAMITGTIQALVFSLLSIVYFSLVVSHEDEH